MNDFCHLLNHNCKQSDYDARKGKVGDNSNITGSTAPKCIQMGEQAAWVVMLVLLLIVPIKLWFLDN